MIKLGTQILFTLMLLALLAVTGLQFGGYMQDRWSSLSNQSNDLYGKISTLEDGAYNFFNKKYPLDLNTTNYYKLKAEFEGVKSKIKSHRILWAFIRKVANAAVYTILPYAIFSLPFIISAGIKRNRKITTLNYGFAFSSLICIVTFFYLVLVPVSCIELSCIVPLITIPVMLLILGTIVTLTSYLLMKRIKNASYRDRDAHR